MLETNYSNRGKPSTFLNREIQRAFREFLHEEIERRQDFDCEMKKLCDERGSLNFDGISLPDLASSRFRIMLVATCNYLWQTKDHRDYAQPRPPLVFSQIQLMRSALILLFSNAEIIKMIVFVSHQKKFQV